MGPQSTPMARLAASGAEGVVCAVSEATSVKELELDLIVATPGIRPAGSEPTDQRRVATPGEAFRSRGGPARRRPPDHGCDRSD